MKHYKKRDPSCKYFSRSHAVSMSLNFCYRGSSKLWLLCTPSSRTNALSQIHYQPNGSCSHKRLSWLPPLPGATSQTTNVIPALSTFKSHLMLHFFCKVFGTLETMCVCMRAQLNCTIYIFLLFPVSALLLFLCCFVCQLLKSVMGNNSRPKKIYYKPSFWWQTEPYSSGQTKTNTTQKDKPQP